MFNIFLSWYAVRFLKRKMNMKMDFSITAEQLASMPVQHRNLYYRMKIIQHTPPKTKHDKFLVKIYRGLLDNPDDLKALAEIDQEFGLTAHQGT